ncbi:hypothetical protein XPA_006916 [Xanthoria parietina]
MSAAEVYLIQSDVRRQATGLDLGLATSPSEDHPYPTFESHLLLAWPNQVFETALGVDPADFVNTAPPAERPCRPGLQCCFCNIPPFQPLEGFWGHQVHKHTDISTFKRLGEIQRTATLWTAYVLQDPEAKTGVRTLEKLA